MNWFAIIIWSDPLTHFKYVSIQNNDIVRPRAVWNQLDQRKEFNNLK